MSIEETKITLYEFCKPQPPDYIDPVPVHMPLGKVLARISKSKHKHLIEQIRAEKGRAKSRELKEKLPAICFSGVIPPGNRTDARITEHSSLAILDFDHLEPQQWQEKWQQLIALPYIVAAFKSPSGDGIKALARILNPAKHREHYGALMKDHPTADAKNINESRVCFESYDPDIYINYKAKPFSKILKVEITIEKKEFKRTPNTNDDIFRKLEKWLQSKTESYIDGNKHNYLFKLACACCRFGIEKEETISLLQYNYLAKDTHCKMEAATKIAQSAYRYPGFGTAELSNEVLVDKKTSKEIIIDLANDFVDDVIYAKDVRDGALDIYLRGYTGADALGIKEIDHLFKWKRGELTVLTGIGNHGKSTFLMFLMLNKAVKDGSKWAIFGPENFPAEEFYLDITEMYLGIKCTPGGEDSPPPQQVFLNAYDFIGKHFFYIYPKELSPTPAYIGSRFLELIIKEKVDGCVIDPFNQLTNDYNSSGGRDDKYLETFLSECSRFAVINNIYYVIVAHPHKLRKNTDNGYDCPDVFDLAGGAMWNNKCDNILVYHRPNRHKDPTDRSCEFHSKKIRRQKIVGAPGMEIFEYSRKHRRFVFDSYPLKDIDMGYISAPDKPYGSKKIKPYTGDVKDITESNKESTGSFGNPDDPF